MLRLAVSLPNRSNIRPLLVRGAGIVWADVSRKALNIRPYKRRTVQTTVAAGMPLLRELSASYPCWQFFSLPYNPKSSE